MHAAALSAGRFPCRLAGRFRQLRDNHTTSNRFILKRCFLLKSAPCFLNNSDEGKINGNSRGDETV